VRVASDGESESTDSLEAALVARGLREKQPVSVPDKSADTLPAAKSPRQDASPRLLAGTLPVAKSPRQDAPAAVRPPRVEKSPRQDGDVKKADVRETAPSVSAPASASTSAAVSSRRKAPPQVSAGLSTTL
jgi:hypothetical protein